MALNAHTAIAAELESFRMARDWSYGRLADAIAEVTSRRRDGDCWRKICQGTAQPQQRTLDILTSFLATVQAPPRRRLTMAKVKGANARRATRKSA